MHKNEWDIYKQSMFLIQLPQKGLYSNAPVLCGFLPEAKHALPNIQDTERKTQETIWVGFDQSQ